MNTSPRRSSIGKGVKHLDFKFGGETYYTQFIISTREKKKYFIHEIHKLAVDVAFTQMMSKKGIKNRG